jgi:hypothetical protein
MKDLIHKEEVYLPAGMSADKAGKAGKIIGICMDVHRQLGKGFLEIVYERCN